MIALEGQQYQKRGALKRQPLAATLAPGERIALNEGHGIMDREGKEIPIFIHDPRGEIKVGTTGARIIKTKPIEV